MNASNFIQFEAILQERENKIRFINNEIIIKIKMINEAKKIYSVEIKTLMNEYFNLIFVFHFSF